MAFEIYPIQDICNMIGKRMVTVDTLTIQNGYIEVGNYYVPLSNILFVRKIE